MGRFNQDLRRRVCDTDGRLVPPICVARAFETAENEGHPRFTIFEVAAKCARAPAARGSQQGGRFDQDLRRHVCDAGRRPVPPVLVVRAFGATENDHLRPWDHGAQGTPRRPRRSSTVHGAGPAMRRPDAGPDRRRAGPHGRARRHAASCSQPPPSQMITHGGREAERDERQCDSEGRT